MIAEDKSSFIFRGVVRSINISPAMTLVDCKFISAADKGGLEIEELDESKLHDSFEMQVVILVILYQRRVLKKLLEDVPPRIFMAAVDLIRAAEAMEVPAGE